MARQGRAPSETSGEEERVSMWQVVLDDIFLLFLLGLSVPVVFYLLWGMWDLVRVPVLKP